MSAVTDLYASVTQRIVAALEAGTVPWQCPWRSAGGDARPANATTARPYRGDKRLIFTAASLAQKAADYVLPAPIEISAERRLGQAA